jgi:hypothetical protein
LTGSAQDGRFPPGEFDEWEVEMVRRIRLVGVVVAGVALLGGSSTPAEDRSSKRACNSINLGGPRVFFKQNMKCEKAKHYARRLYKTDGRDEPRNFNCQSGSNFNQGGGCRHDFKNKLFGWHPVDKRKVSTHHPSPQPGEPDHPPRPAVLRS